MAKTTKVERYDGYLVRVAYPAFGEVVKSGVARDVVHDFHDNAHLFFASNVDLHAVADHVSRIVPSAAAADVPYSKAERDRDRDREKEQRERDREREWDRDDGRRGLSPSDALSPRATSQLESTQHGEGSGRGEKCISPPTPTAAANGSGDPVGGRTSTTRGAGTSGKTGKGKGRRGAA
eukprot:TRINITY_DN7759_c0_g1_i1.p2 TRINITY_DN7759_c0_g1~~TRINITY_DN7759_c0_g1_i1.p2  ORF type:complete len:179 (-),score=12.04 TRINITY_DN7759_c0_g1_i1:40-576(-)